MWQRLPQVGRHLRCKHLFPSQAGAATLDSAAALERLLTALLQSDRQAEAVCWESCFCWGRIELLTGESCGAAPRSYRMQGPDIVWGQTRGKGSSNEHHLTDGTLPDWQFFC